MRGDESAQLMVVAAVIVAVGMMALALVTYSSMGSEGEAVHSGVNDASLTFSDLKKTYEQAVLRAYDDDRDNPGDGLSVFRRNISRWAERHGYSVVLLPRNVSENYGETGGYLLDSGGDVFNGSIIVTDGTTRFRDDVNVDLTG